jgi:hypothetical protein
LSEETFDYLEFLKQFKKDEVKLGQVKTAEKYDITQVAVSLIVRDKRSGFQVWKKLYGRKDKK